MLRGSVWSLHPRFPMWRALSLLALASLQLNGCVNERCTMDRDCPAPQVCGTTGRCQFQCEKDSDCGDGFRCEANQCVAEEHKPIECPPDMVAVQNVFCIDKYEASRVDATADSPGVAASTAVSRPGVIPWQVGDDNGLADAMCQAAGKRLCTPFEWELACRGSQGRAYGYGNAYDKFICNGIDTFGKAALKLLPTASLEQCVNDWGAFDLNGNLWEHVADGDGTSVRGGAYNCIDSMTLHRCDYIPRTWVPSALGFRCCMTPEGGVTPPSDVVTPTDVVAPTDSDSTGCLDPDVPDAQGDVVEEIHVECTQHEECLYLEEASDGCRETRCDTGKCLLQAREDGWLCSDLDPCTQGDACLNGACEPGTLWMDCDDGNLCTDDVCVSLSGCSITDNAAPCEDANPCTQSDQCVGGECIAGANVCACEVDQDCPNDLDACNGALYCDASEFPNACKLVPDSVVVCGPPSGPCQQSLCDPLLGSCVESPVLDGVLCDDGNACNGDDFCILGICTPGTETLCGCPDDMVTVQGEFCMDRYEASRPDATAGSYGADSSVATSRPGVLPWFPVEYAGAKSACEAAGKRLCAESEVQLACSGTGGTAYVYGNAYSATTCNGIDAFCLCGSANCAALAECPYPHCYSQSPEGTYGMGCGASFHVVATGSFPGCINEWGAYDVNGNVWELVDTGTTESWYKGGAYNCGDSEYLHNCFGKFQGISAKGFRCCKDLAVAGGTP